MASLGEPSRLSSDVGPAAISPRVSGDEPLDILVRPAEPHTRGNPTNTEWRYTTVDSDVDKKNAIFFKPEGTIQKLLTNEWPRAFGKQMRTHAVRHCMAGVEIKTIDAPHPLAGEQVVRY